MNKKPVLYKSLIVGVIVLFIGVGVQPAVATVQIEEETGISQKIRTQFDRINNKLDTIENDDSKSSRLNPEHKDEFQELYDKITVINGDFNNIKSSDYPIINWLLNLIRNLFIYFVIIPIWLVLGILYFIFFAIPGMILIFILAFFYRGPL